jgi:hypothetical protein
MMAFGIKDRRVVGEGTRIPRDDFIMGEKRDLSVEDVKAWATCQSLL